MNRVISGWVMVTGPPSSICRSNKGTTLPRLPTTLPKRTAQQLIGPRYASTICSHSRLVQPMTECLEAALSVEIRMKRFTRAASAQRSVFQVPTTFVSTAWMGWTSSIGTCLYAPTWKTMSGRSSANKLTSSGRSTIDTRASRRSMVEPRRSSSDRSNSPLSLVSTRTKRRGPIPAISRHSSEPIDPAAPVTSTTLLRTSAAANPRSISLWSRPTRSSAESWRSLEPLGRGTQSSAAGTMNTGICAARHCE